MIIEQTNKINAHCCAVAKMEKEKDKKLRLID